MRPSVPVIQNPQASPRSLADILEEQTRALSKALALQKDICSLLKHRDMCSFSLATPQSKSCTDLHTFSSRTSRTPRPRCMSPQPASQRQCPSEEEKRAVANAMLLQTETTKSKSDTIQWMNLGTSTLTPGQSVSNDAGGLTQPLMKESSEETFQTPSNKVRFPTPNEMETQLKELKEEEVDVEKLYKPSGICQAMVRSNVFHTVVMIVIACNTLWVSIDTDYNHADNLLNAPCIFQIADNAFCLFFVVELTVRVMAFEKKLDALKDTWLICDSLLVFMMVWETWVEVLVYAVLDETIIGGGRSWSVLRMFRLLRLLRAGRVMRLMHAFPELMFYVCGMVQAVRAVLCALMLLATGIYVFAIIFTLVFKGTDLGSDFENVPQAMNTLLLRVLCGFDVDYLQRVLAVSIFYYFLYFLFMMFASITVMNMLVAVLVDVVQTSAEAQRSVRFRKMVEHEMVSIISEGDADGDLTTVSQEEFAHMLNSTSSLRKLQNIDVDLVALVTFVEHLFKGRDNVSLSEVIEAMQVSFSKNATLKDVMELRQFVIAGFAQMEGRNHGDTKNCLRSETV